MSDKRVSEHFLEAEFTCNHCGKLAPGGIPKELVEVLEDIRAHFARPVVIYSAYRCPEHNRRVGGAVASQHLVGTAADIKVVGVSPPDVRSYLYAKYPQRYGIGSYKTFTHVDVRAGYARW